MKLLSSFGCVALVVCCGLAVAETPAAKPQAWMPQKHFEVFRNHCFDCHDASTQEGKLNLEELSFEISKDVSTAEWWAKILDAINAGEMPPEDGEPISDEDKAALLEDLSIQMVLARKILSDTGGEITMRRLNRREYQNTLETLLGFRPDVSTLPDDDAVGEFDTSGASLFFSSDQFEQYRATATRALEAVLGSVSKRAPNALASGARSGNVGESRPAASAVGSRPRKKPQAQVRRVEPEVEISAPLFEQLEEAVERLKQAKAYLAQKEKPPTDFGFRDHAHAEGEGKAKPSRTFVIPTRQNKPGNRTKVMRRQSNTRDTGLLASSLLPSVSPSPHPSISPSRRAFLRTSSACIALPFLESLWGRRWASAADAATPAPKRVIFLGMGFGVTAEAWYPDIHTPGHDYELPESLGPLTRHKKDITIFQNLEHANSKDGHSGSTFWLTGADRYAIPGQNFHNTISVDQVAAEQFGNETRYSSIILDTTDGYAGHGPGSISWNRQGKPIMGLPNPVAFYHKLFSASSMPLEQRQALLADDRSALDTVLADARSVKKGLTKTDAEKVDEYFESIREIEVRIAKEEKWLTVPKKQPADPVKQPPESLEGVPEVEMMYDLMLAAMQVDASRVFSYRLPGDSFVASFGSSYTVHNLSHYGGSPARTEDSKLRDRKHAELIGKFIDKLQASKEPDGSSLYDNVTLAFGSNLRVTHSLNNCPTLITGGGSGFKHGRHLVMEKKTPLCNLWLSMLRGSGVQAEAFGDATGVIDELFVS